MTQSFNSNLIDQDLKAILVIRVRGHRTMESRKKRLIKLRQEGYGIKRTGPLAPVIRLPRFERRWWQEDTRTGHGKDVGREFSDPKRVSSPDGLVFPGNERLVDVANTGMRPGSHSELNKKLSYTIHERSIQRLSFILNHLSNVSSA